VALRAYIDDSRTDGKVLILGGFVATSERWNAFSDDWERSLSGAPWPKSAKTLSPVFKANWAIPRAGDPQVMDYLRRHYSVIRDHKLHAVTVAIPLKAVDWFVAMCDPQHKTWRNPYMWAMLGLMDTLVAEMRDRGASEPIDFIFDQRPEKKHFTRHWNLHLENLPTMREMFARAPVFESDDTTLPLQAADMWAGYSRLAWLEDGNLVQANRFPIPFGLDGDLRVWLFEADPHEMEDKYLATWARVNLDCLHLVVQAQC
jgi:hypothetical protein